MRRAALLLLAAGLWAWQPVLAAEDPSLSPELQELAVSAGHWVYHGEALGTEFSKPGTWTWDEQCGWSVNRLFMVCSFTNDWSGRVVKSLVVDTYSGKDKSYWHYELFNDSGAQPFVSRMDIHGNTRVELAKSLHQGKAEWTRITYVFDSPTRVTVKIETSRDGTHWVTVDRGEGTKQR